MTRDDDRDFWRREDDRSEQRDRDFWREQDLRREHQREDREYEIRRREREHADGWRAVRDGDTAEALRNFVGPEAAISYLRATEHRQPSRETRRLWVRHIFVTELAELVENVEAAPGTATFNVGKPDREGDIVVHVKVGERVERFWVRRQLLRRLSTSTPVPQRARQVVAALIQRRGVLGFDLGLPWMNLPSLLDAARDTSRRRTPRMPHTMVHTLAELVDNVAAAAGAELIPQRIDGDGDGVVEARIGETTERFYVKPALLAQLTAFASAPDATLPLLRALGRLVRDEPQP